MSIYTKLQSLNVKFLFLTIVCAGSGILSSQCFAEENIFNGPIELSTQDFKELKINGPSTLHAIKADSFIGNGPVDFIKLKINRKAEISGPCKGMDGEFRDVVIHGPFEGTKISAVNFHVNGPVAIEDFKITGNVTINGPLKAKVGSFKDINTVNTPVALYDVTVHNIYVKKDSTMNKDDNANNDGYAKNYEIKLAGKTIVYGNITFESGDGIVYIRDKTAQFKGKVIGGKIKE
jgi:hypothetical protein